MEGAARLCPLQTLGGWRLLLGDGEVIGSDRGTSPRSPEGADPTRLRRCRRCGGPSAPLRAALPGQRRPVRVGFTRADPRCAASAPRHSAVTPARGLSRPQECVIELPAGASRPGRECGQLSPSDQGKHHQHGARGRQDRRAGQVEAPARRRPGWSRQRSTSRSVPPTSSRSRSDFARASSSGCAGTTSTWNGGRSACAVTRPAVSTAPGT